MNPVSAMIVEPLNRHSLLGKIPPFEAWWRHRELDLRSLLEGIVTIFDGPCPDLDQIQTVSRDLSAPVLNGLIDYLARPGEPVELAVICGLDVMTAIEMTEDSFSARRALLRVKIEHDGVGHLHGRPLDRGIRHGIALRGGRVDGGRGGLRSRRIGRFNAREPSSRGTRGDSRRRQRIVRCAASDRLSPFGRRERGTEGAQSVKNTSSRSEEPP